MNHRINLLPKESKAFLTALKPYLDQHPKAQVDMYRRGKYILRLRIIDPDFAGMDRKDRDDLIWDMLYERLPKELLEDITMVLLLTPAEADESMANTDFEKPLPLEV